MTKDLADGEHITKGLAGGEDVTKGLADGRRERHRTLRWARGVVQKRRQRGARPARGPPGIARGWQLSSSVSPQGMDAWRTASPPEPSSGTPRARLTDSSTDQTLRCECHLGRVTSAGGNGATVLSAR